MFNRFPAKILLFGEYAVLEGGEALSIPYNERGGQFSYGIQTDEQRASARSVHQFFSWLIKEHRDRFNMNALEEDLEKGIFFDSSIPVGYGVGSSAALVAATVGAYAQEVPESSEELQSFLAEIEGYFHGKSSGLDALVSFRGKAFHKTVSGKLRELDYPGLPKHQFILIDSKQTGPTGKLVSLFRERMTNLGWKNRFTTEFIEHGNRAIHGLVENDSDVFASAVASISKFTVSEMQFALPQPIETLALELQNRKLGFLKLCGSGGGGFFLLIHPAKDGLDMERDTLLQDFLPQ